MEGEWATRDLSHYELHGISNLTNTVLVPQEDIAKWKVQRLLWMQRKDPPTAIPPCTPGETSWPDLPPEMQGEVLAWLVDTVRYASSENHWWNAVIGLCFFSMTNKATRQCVRSAWPGLVFLKWCNNDNFIPSYRSTVYHKIGTRDMIETVSLASLWHTVVAANKTAIGELFDTIIDELRAHYPGKIQHQMENLLNSHGTELRSVGFSGSSAKVVAVLDVFGYVGGSGVLTERHAKTGVAQIVSDQLVCSRTTAQRQSIQGILTTILEGAILGGHDTWAFELFVYIKKTFGKEVDDQICMNMAAAHGRQRLFQRIWQYDMHDLSQYAKAFGAAVMAINADMVSYLLKEKTWLTPGDLFNAINLLVQKKHELGLYQSDILNERRECILVALMNAIPLGDHSSKSAVINGMVGILAEESVDKYMANGWYRYCNAQALANMCIILIDMRRYAHALKIITDNKNALEMVERLARHCVPPHNPEEIVLLFEKFNLFTLVPTLAQRCLVRTWIHCCNARHEDTKDMSACHQFILRMCEVHGATFDPITRMQCVSQSMASELNVDFLGRVLKHGFDPAVHCPTRQDWYQVIRHCNMEQLTFADTYVSRNPTMLDRDFWTWLMAREPMDRVVVFARHWYVTCNIHCDAQVLIDVAMSHNAGKFLTFMHNELGTLFAPDVLYRVLEKTAGLHLITALIECDCLFDFDMVDAILVSLEADVAPGAGKSSKRRRQKLKNVRDYFAYLCTK